MKELFYTLEKNHYNSPYKQIKEEKEGPVQDGDLGRFQPYFLIWKHQINRKYGTISSEKRVKTSRVSSTYWVNKRKPTSKLGGTETESCHKLQP